MAISLLVRRLVKLNQLIETGQTGTSQDVAEKLGVSGRQVRTYLVALEELGKKTSYNRKTGSYEYKEDSEWTINWPR